jgi:ATP-binding cassette, subfamily B, bacterial
MRDRFRSAWELISVGRRIDAALVVELVVSTVMTNVALALRALWFKLLVDAVVAGQVTLATGWGLVLAVSDALRSVALVRMELSKMDLQDRAVEYFQAESMRLAGSAPRIDHYERQSELDKLDQFRQTLPELSGALASVVDGMAVVARAAFVLVLLAFIHPALLLLPLFAVPSLFAGRGGERAMQIMQLKTAAPTRRSEHLYGLLTRPAAVKELRLFGLEPELRRRDAALWRSTTDQQLQGTVRAQATNLVGWSVFAIGYVAAMALVAHEALEGRASAGDLLLTVILAGLVNDIVQQSAGLVALMTRASHAVDLYRWLERLSPGRNGNHDTDQGGATSPEQNGGPAEPPTRLERGIALEDVSFRYPEGARDVLRDINLTLPAGSVVAIVGENGAGKSTLVKLLLGLYAPDRGRVLVDGQDATRFELERWRERTSAGFQDFARFELLARLTVGVGDLAKHADPDAVTAAIGQAAATDVVAALPAGLDTQLGSTFDGGVDLSGGQWQKLAVARAMMRTDCLLMVLDEPTAAIDASSEHALVQRYAEAARRASGRGAITVLVSHRFSTVRLADLIVVMADGRIIESGTHDELTALDGMYADLYEMQAMHYR